MRVIMPSVSMSSVPTRITRRTLPLRLWSLAVLAGLCALLLWALPAHADISPASLISRPTGNGGQSWSVPIQTLVILTSMTFIPIALLMMTSFTRIVIVFSLLRTAMGTNSAPPNQILIGLSLFLTFFIMSPVISQVYDQAYVPLAANKITFQEAIDRGAGPVRTFMLHQTRETDIAMLARIADMPEFHTPADVPMRVLMPAFALSELKSAFQIGFMIFIPFLVIDLVVASVLMALGMMMVPPSTISLPFKLMLFVLVDGWSLLVGSLAQSFYM